MTDTLRVVVPLPAGRNLSESILRWRADDAAKQQAADRGVHALTPPVASGYTDEDVFGSGEPIVIAWFNYECVPIT